MTQPTLYILMRTDMDSLNAGKAMAQAAHAANAFHATALSFTDPVPGFDKWLGSEYPTPSNFGTTIVLGVNSERELFEVTRAADEDGFLSGTVLDHTYPIRDGSVMHLLPVTTCGYIFTDCRKTNQVSSLAGLELHK